MNADWLLSKTATKRQLLRRLRLLKDFLYYKIYDSHSSLLDQTFADFRKQIKDINVNQATDPDLDFLKSLGENFYNQFNQTNTNPYLKDLEKAIGQAKIIQIYIPFEIPNEEINNLSSWFKVNLGSNTLFEPIYDVNLVGGCALAINGHYKDYSLRQKIKEHQKEIITSLLSFKR